MNTDGMKRWKIQLDKLCPEEQCVKVFHCLVSLIQDGEDDSLNYYQINSIKAIRLDCECNCSEVDRNVEGTDKQEDNKNCAIKLLGRKR